MSIPKNKKFTDFDQYENEPNPTTSAALIDYLNNQNLLLEALVKRLWQPQTVYKVGDIIFSPTMNDGLIAQCVIAGTTGADEPEWGVNEASVVDNTCTWIMRPAYCYGLATESDVDNAYNNSSVEGTRLLSLGVFHKLFDRLAKLASPAFTGTPTAPTAAAGNNTTQLATTAFVKAAIDALGISAYAKLASPALSGTPTAPTPASSDNSTKLATTAFVKALAGAANNGGIIAQSLGTNGYVKFANGLILQWGAVTADSTTFPLAYVSACYVFTQIITTANWTAGAQAFAIKSKSLTGFTGGNNDGRQWFSIGK